MYVATVIHDGSSAIFGMSKDLDSIRFNSVRSMEIEAKAWNYDDTIKCVAANKPKENRYFHKMVEAYECKTEQGIWRLEIVKL